MEALAIGPFEAQQVERLAAAASQVGLQLAQHESVKAVCRTDATELPVCVLVPAAKVSAVARRIRANDVWFNVPVIAVVARADDRAYRAAFAEGADDAVVASDRGAIERRLANLCSRDVSARPPAEKGVALVAAASPAHRQHLGRVLRHAGFDVAFACEARELMNASAHRPTLVVATADFPPLGGEAAVRTVRTATRQPEMPAIVLDAGELGRGPGALDTRGELLFFADEATRGAAAVDQRASRRFHYATLCAYRQPGENQYTHGLTHDISREGIFVRTLDPPAAGTRLWLELRTPDGRSVHLRGDVVWQRHPAQLGPTAPPGFGLRIRTSACPPPDLAAYGAGYDSLLTTPVLH